MRGFEGGVFMCCVGEGMGSARVLEKGLIKVIGSILCAGLCI